jgi:hypothetical protein
VLARRSVESASSSEEQDGKLSSLCFSDCIGVLSDEKSLAESLAKIEFLT